MPRLPARMVTQASFGLRIAAITGTMMISRVIRPGPPMNGDRGKNVEMMNTAANAEERVRSLVVRVRLCVLLVPTTCLPTPGLVWRNGWEAPLTRLNSPKAGADLRLVGKRTMS